MIKITTTRPEVEVPPAQINIEDLDDTTIVTLRVLLGNSGNPTDHALYRAIRKITDPGITVYTTPLIEFGGNSVRVNRDNDPERWDKLLANVQKYRQRED